MGFNKVGRNRENSTHMKASSFFNPDSDRYGSVVKIGKGGMGTVYKAHDTALDKEIVIKIVDPGQDYEKSAVRFQKEAKALSKLKHDNLVTVYDFGIASDGTLYMILEYIDGLSLRKRLLNEGILEYEDALNIFRQVCKGLKHAHDECVVHRDIKPDNVIIFELENRGTCAKVIDFGIALTVDQSKSQVEIATQNESTAGSPLYMAPEIIKGNPGSIKSDIYALGCLLFEMLTGHVPFRGETLVETFDLHARAPIPKVEDERATGTKIDEVIKNCLAKDPEKRYQDIDALVQALEAMETEEKVPGDSGNLSEFERPKRSNIYLYSGLSLLFLAGVIALVYFILLPPQEPKSALEEEQNKVEKEKKIVENEYPHLLANDVIEEKVNQGEPFVLEKKSGYDLAWRGNLLTLKDSDFKTLNRKTPHNIYLKQCPVNGTGLKFLEDKQRWCIQAMSFEGSDLTDEGMEELVKFKTLSKLDLTNTKITDRSLRLLEELPHLNRLEISYCTNLTEPGVQRLLEKCRSLVNIKLKNLNLTNKIIPYIVSSNLNYVEMGGIQLTNDDIRKLIKNRSFMRLGFSFNKQITEEILPELVSVDGIQEIDLTGCENISDEVRDKVEKKYKVKIDDEHKNGHLKDQKEMFEQALPNY